MFFAQGREHVDPYYNLLGILKLDIRLKNDKSNSPAVLLNIPTPASETHSYNTSMLQIKTSLSHQYAPRFKFLAIKIWESFPPELNCFPYMLIKKRDKRFLLTTQK